MMLLHWNPLSRIHEITKIDMWFLQYEELYTLEKKFQTKVDTLPRELLLEAKQKVLPTDKLHT
jgi:carbamoyl-phosphate synthase large subunit